MLADAVTVTKTMIDPSGITPHGVQSLRVCDKRLSRDRSGAKSDRGFGAAVRGSIQFIGKLAITDRDGSYLMGQLRSDGCSILCRSGFAQEKRGVAQLRGQAEVVALAVGQH